MNSRQQLDVALQAAMAANARNDAAAALRWFDRARRLAPDSPFTAFMHAVALGGSNPPAALAKLLGLVERWPDFREAHFALAAVRLRIGGAADAAAALAAALHRFGLPPHADPHLLAMGVAARVEAPGWISLDGPSSLTLGLLPQPEAVVLQLRQSGGVLLERTIPAGPQQEVQVPLPGSTKRNEPLAATVDGRPCLGSALVPGTVLRLEALLQPTANGRLRGHAWMPGVPEACPVMTLRVDGEADRCFTVRGRAAALPGNPLARARGFSVRLPAGVGPVSVLGPDGQQVPGSPVYPMAIPPPALPPPRAGVDVIIPVIRGAAELRHCLASLGPALPPQTRVVVVDDGATDPDLLALLRRRQRAGAIMVLRHTQNRGYPAAVNTGLRHAAGRDVVLLNPDTLLPPGCLGRLRAAAYAEPDIGSVTPLSNEASIVSYPDRDGGNPPLVGKALRLLDQLCQQANPGCRIDLPTAVGFCMYVRAACLAATGGYREDVFAQGYGEENDWCLRASALGWRHVAAADVFVTHLGGSSFGRMRNGLLTRNLAALNRLHPGYDALVRRFLQRDALAPARRRLDMARRQHYGAAELVLLVTHDLGGGVTQFVRDRCHALEAEGYRTLLLRPHEGAVVLEPVTGPACPNLRFRLPQEWAVLVAWLRGQRVARVEVQHTLNHVPDVTTLAQRLGVPFDVYVHDNVFFCPRLTLVGRSGRYCGEPLDPAVCDACVAELGSFVPGAPPVAALRAQSGALFDAARQVVVPCQDAARRVRRYTSTSPLVRPWQDDGALPPRRRPAPGVLRVAVVGALNQDKGLDVLLDCARTARAAALPIEFVLIGFSLDDAALVEAGVFVTGEFAAGEAASLLHRERPGLGFLPSVWPETWCYALTDIWQAGVDVLCFDIGAQAERVRASGRGRLLPLGVPARRILTTLLAMQSAGAQMGTSEP